MEEGKSRLRFSSLTPPLSFREASPLAPHTCSRSTASQKKNKRLRAETPGEELVRDQDGNP